MKFFSIIFIFSIFSGIQFLSPQLAVAHGTGISLEQVVGDYFIDVGYNPEILEAGDSAIFDFNLFLDETREKVEFTDIWVRIVQNKKTFFASGIHKPEIGSSTLLYAFPRVGAYELSVRFQNKGESVAEASFPLTVGGTEVDDADSPNLFLFWIIAGIFGGAIAGFFAGLFKKEKKK